MTRGWSVRVVVCAVVAASCSSSSGSGGGSFQADWEAYCAKDAQRDEQCGGTSNEAGCIAAASCIQSGWRPSAVLQAADCAASRPCGESDDSCFEQAGNSVPDNAITQQYFAKCSSWLSACAPGSDDLCAPSAKLLSDARLAELTACFDKACADAEGCVDSAVADIDCW